VTCFCVVCLRPVGGSPLLSLLKSPQLAVPLPSDKLEFLVGLVPYSFFFFPPKPCLECLYLENTMVSNLVKPLSLLFVFDSFPHTLPLPFTAARWNLFSFSLMLCFFLNLPSVPLFPRCKTKNYKQKLPPILGVAPSGQKTTKICVTMFLDWLSSPWGPKRAFGFFFFGLCSRNLPCRCSLPPQSELIRDPLHPYPPGEIAFPPPTG